MRDREQLWNAVEKAEKRKDSESICAQQRNLRCNEGYNPYWDQEAEPIKNRDADGLDVSQRAENRMPGLALGHYHSDAKDYREYQHTHTVV